MKAKNKLKLWQWNAYNGCPVMTPKGITKKYSLYRELGENWLNAYDLEDAEASRRFEREDCKLVLHSFESLTEDELGDLGFLCAIECLVYVKKGCIIITPYHDGTQAPNGNIVISNRGHVSSDIIVSGLLHSIDTIKLAQWFYDKEIAFGLEPNSWVDSKTLNQNK